MAQIMPPPLLYYVRHDTVAVARGRTLRGLVVQLGIFSSDEAPFLDIAQGAVYVIRNGNLSRYS